MSITRNNPNTIFLGGRRVQIGDIAAKEVIIPGHLVERINTAGVTQWRKHATAAGDCSRAVATDQAMLNKGVDDTYAINDLMEVSIGEPGSTFWMLLPSGQTIVYGDGLESNGDGQLRKLAAGVLLFKALEAKTTTAATRIRVETV